MSTLVFQVTIKQWDKSQRSLECVSARADVSTAYPIVKSAQFLVFDTPCIIDQHTFSSIKTDEHSSLKAIQNIERPLKKAMLSDGAIKLERVILSKQEDGDLAVSYQKEQAEPILIAHLKPCVQQGWIQVKYQWRYRIEKANEIFWQYEEVTMNIALNKDIDKDYFVNTKAAVIKEFE